MDKEITIPIERYESLLRSEKFLNALESAGVDNWDYYSEAYREAYPEDDDEE